MTDRPPASAHGVCTRCKANVRLVDTYVEGGEIHHRLAPRGARPPKGGLVCGPVRTTWTYRVVYQAEHTIDLPFPLEAKRHFDAARVELGASAGVEVLMIIGFQEIKADKTP
jgi:hypothetical protein